MPANVHRKNTTFQLRYFIAGQCYTPDGAWAMLYNQRTDIESNLNHAEAQRLRRQAAIKRAEAKKEDPNATEADKIEAEADKIDQEADISAWERNVQGAQDELDAINQLMSELEPFRKYSDYDPLKASELAQHDEWREELKSRAENMLASNRLGIPWDHLQTMRSHPDFHEQILPHIIEVRSKLQSPSKNQLENILDQPTLFHDKEN